MTSKGRGRAAEKGWRPHLHESESSKPVCGQEECWRDMDRFRDVDGRRQIAATSGGIIDEISRSASAQEGNVRGEAEYGMASAGQRYVAHV